MAKSSASGRQGGTETLPPSDVAAEEAVLGAAMLDPGACAEVLGRLAAEDLYRPAHRTVYQAIRSLHSQGRRPDVVTVGSELQAVGALPDVGGAPFLHTLTAAVPTVAQAGSYIEIVAGLARRRRLIDAGHQLVQLGREETDPNRATTLARGLLAGVEGRGDGSGAVRLRIADLDETLVSVDKAGPPRWLIKELWPADAYGVLAAEDKAGKTWAQLDLAVSVAKGVPWLGRFDCPTPGPVLLFLGEGGERAMVRRLRAIAEHKRLGAAGLAIRWCFRVPRLRNGEDLAVIQAELSTHPARLVVLDPLYLAVDGAKGSDLYEMGAALAAIQGICQDAGSALAVVTHWNKTGEGRGAKRISGVGPGAWGRVLASAGVDQRRTEPDGTSNVVLAFEVTGGELADTSFRVRRRVRATDPADLGSPLAYTVEVLEPSQPAGDQLSPAARRVLEALREGGEMQSVQHIGDRTASDGQGKPLRRPTIQHRLVELELLGLAKGTEVVRGQPRYWSAVTP
jgi:AAA domain/DnaB-like helicase N terminal domain